MVFDLIKKDAQVAVRVWDDRVQVLDEAYGDMARFVEKNGVMFGETKEEGNNFTEAIGITKVGDKDSADVISTEISRLTGLEKKEIKGYTVNGKYIEI
jgi:hypothetical protein